jgi:Skp family chaperone for outer membrane proteins
MSRKLTLFSVVMLAASMPALAQNPPVQNPPVQNPPTAQAPAAQTPAAPAVIGPAKIAFVDIQAAIATCDEGKREATLLQQYVDQKSAELQNKQKELEALRTKMDVSGSKLNDEARQELAEQIDAKDTEVQRFQQDTQKDIDNRRTKLQNSIGNKMLKSIEKVAQEKGVDVVQFVGIANIYGYINPSLLITDEVVKAYNIANPAIGAPPVKK